MSTGSFLPAAEPQIAPANPHPPRRIGLLWRRIVAGAIDFIFLGMIGHVVAWPFFNTLVGLGPAAKLVGFFIGILYLAVPESSIGQGASIGKRLLLLQVVHADGSPLTIEESLIRYCVFEAPLLLTGLALPLPRFPMPLYFLLAALICSIGALTQYLILFNRNTRQGLHDLAVSCFVAEADVGGPVTVKPIWKPHWRIAAALLAALNIGGGVFYFALMSWPAYRQLLEDARLIEQVQGVQSVSVNKIWQVNAGTSAGTNGLGVVIRATCPEDGEEALADEAARALIEGDGGFKDYERVTISVVRGYDIGIASSFRSQRYSDTPEAWMRRVGAVLDR